MKKLFAVIVMLLTTCWGCSDKAKEWDDANGISEIKALSAARAKAFNDGDANAIANAFTESGILMPPNSSPLTGREAVREYYQHIFDQYQTFLESGYEDVKVSAGLGYGRGHAIVKLVPHTGGDTLISTAKYINILERQEDGSWLTTHDIWNANE